MKLDKVHLPGQFFEYEDNKKICAHNYPCTVFCFSWTVYESILCQTFFAYKKKFVKKMNLNFNPWDFQHRRN